MPQITCYPQHDHIRKRLAWSSIEDDDVIEGTALLSIIGGTRTSPQLIPEVSREQEDKQYYPCSQ